KTKALQDDKRQVLQQINEQHNRLAKARELLLSGDIDPADYKTMKTEHEKKVAMLEGKLSQFADNSNNIDRLLHTAINNLSKLDALYESGNIGAKRDIIGSLYPEKMTFEGNALRTTRINEAALYMYGIVNNLEPKKKGTNHSKNDLSRFVPR